MQVPPPPVQLPPVADSIYDFVMTAFTAAQQTPEEINPCALPEISMANSANPGTALVGDPVSFTYTVTNPGTVPLTDLQIESALPSGLSFVSATSQGAVNGDTGYVEWALESGLAPGASTQLSVSATIASPGEWTNNACSAGQDAIGNEVKDCASATVFGGVLTATPTATPTPTATTMTTTPTPTLTAPTATATPVGLAPVQPIAPTPLPPVPVQPIAPTPLPPAPCAADSTDARSTRPRATESTGGPTRPTTSGVRLGP